MALAPGDALPIVDVQRDFLRGGAQAVPSGNRVLQPIARLIRVFVARDLTWCQSFAQACDVH